VDLAERKTDDRIVANGVGAMEAGEEEGFEATQLALGSAGFSKAVAKGSH
jgi:hypothetical protein